MLLPGAAVAQRAPQACMPQETVGAILARSYNEYPVGWMLSASGHVLTLYVSEKRTWTLVSTDPFGCSAMVESGEGFSRIQARRRPEL